MPKLNFAQKTMLKALAGAVLINGLFFWWMSIQAHWQWVLLGLGFFLCAQILVALVLGRRITRKIIFDSRLKRKLKSVKHKINELLAVEHQINDSLFEGLIVLDHDNYIISYNFAARVMFSLPHNMAKISLLEAVRIPELHDRLCLLREQDYCEPFIITLKNNRVFEVKIVFLKHQGRVLLLFIDRSFAQEFVIHASHELKTPMSIILANAENLLDISDNQQEQALLKAIIRQAQRSQKLIESLLDWARFETRSYTAHAEAINLKAFFTSLVSEHHFNVKLSIDCQSELRALVDPYLLERLIVILIENTAKYAGHDASMKIKASIIKEEIDLVFHDNGPGIAARYRERVFDPFFRQPHHEQIFSGFGLGLSQARTLAHAMGSEISVLNGITQGCAIRLFLPLAPKVILDRPVQERALVGA